MRVVLIIAVVSLFSVMVGCGPVSMVVPKAGVSDGDMVVRRDRIQAIDAFMNHIGREMGAKGLSDEAVIRLIEEKERIRRGGIR